MLQRSLVISFLLLPLAVSSLADEVNFNRDVRPLLSDRCFHCHGPDEHDRQAGLRLDRADGPEGAYARAIAQGSPEESELWNRITSEDPDLLMPPAESPKQPLTNAEIEILRQWIEQGAEYQAFWAFVTPSEPKLPTEAQGDPIDRFVRRRLQEAGLKPMPRADKRTLIRRLSLDLTGLPPTRKEIAEFLADDSPGAYEKLVDRLLADPHYGEHMAKYWLDLVRFADTNGIHHDHFRDMSPYRDWVIRAFNEDLPYSEFTRYQLAGDLFEDPTQDQLVASGFHRLHLIIDAGTALPEESYTRNVIDRVSSFGTAFMGMTVQCAVCHDHKYDPITTRDFYSLFAFFNNIDAKPETGGRRGVEFERGLQSPYVYLTTERHEAELQELTQAFEAANKLLAATRAELGKSEGDQRQQADASVRELEEQVRTARVARENLLRTIPAAMVMKERAEPRPAYILVRGDYDKLGDEVGRATPAFLPPMKDLDGQPSRMDLADWIVDPTHPLTARVAVNRFWQQIFGVGLVRTAEDFGAQGEWPSHPELLDYLAVRFVENGWSVRGLMKEIVMSETYRQSAHSPPEAYRHDPENRLLSRGSRYRLDSEVVRDHVLATSGLLNPKMFGPSVKPPQPDGLWTAVTMPDSYPRVFKADEGDQIYRRSLYTFWKRGLPPPQMTIMNAPSREECVARRERTNTPLQALLLLNEVEYLKAARHLSARLLPEHRVQPEELVDALYETITAQIPTPKQRQAFLELAADLEVRYAESPHLAELLCDDLPLAEGITRPQLAAWTIVASTIYNLDITRTRQ